MTESNALSKVPSNQIQNVTSLGDFDLKRQMIEIDRSPLSFLEKRKLLKQNFKALAEIKQAEGDASVSVARAGVEAKTEIEIKSIAAQKINIMNQLQRRFNDMMATVGQQVEMDKLSSLQTFGDKLTEFEKKLRESNIAPRFQQQILQKIDESWEGYCDKLAEVGLEVMQKKNGPW